MTVVPRIVRRGLVRWDIVHRAAALAVVGVLAFGPLAACSSDNVNCTLDSCTVTLDRGVEAEADVLGVNVKLVGVQNGNVTVNVGGTDVTVPTDGEAQAEGLNVDVQEVTDKKVVLKISKQN